VAASVSLSQFGFLSSNPDAIAYQYDSQPRYEGTNQQPQWIESGAVVSSYSWTAGFDDIDRVNQYNRSNGDNQSWNLDNIGNWTATSGAYSNLSFLENRSHNNTHELTAVNGNSLAYDLKGNLLSTEYSSYTWDIDNHLQEVINGSSVTLAYDAIGRRVSKGDTLFVSHGQQVIEEYTQTSSTPTPIYSLTRTYIHATYVDDIIAKIEHDTLPPAIHYYHVDRQFNVRGLTSSTGSILELYAYSPYGKQTIINPSNPSTLLPVSSYSNNYGFTGRYLDSEIGLWYFRARYFSDELGRFISRDPLRYVDGMSLYGGYFAQGFRADPTGLFTWLDDLIYVCFYEECETLTANIVVVGSVVEVANGQPGETPTQQSQRGVANRLGQLSSGVSHVDVYANGVQIRGGAAGGTNGGGVVDISSNPQWPLSKVDSGTLRWGSGAGTPCCEATDAQIIDSIRSAGIQGRNYNGIFNNCQHDVERAIRGSCLTGYDAIGPGPPEHLYQGGTPLPSMGEATGFPF
jgi:RHS repeat-associated protein